MMSIKSDEYLVIGAKSFGSAIREFRRRRHISQQQFADDTHMHRSYLSALEGGATTDAVRRIMRALRTLDLEVVVRERRRR